MVNYVIAGTRKADSDSAQRGFTLVELMITLAVAAILMSLAVPSFTSTIKNNRLTTQANDLIATLNYARSEAIRRGANVSVDSNDASANWHNGWVVKDSSNNILRNHQAFEGSSTLVAASSVSSLSYRSTGFLSGSSAITFTLCDDRSGETGRTISISLTGRPSVSNYTCDS